MAGNTKRIEEPLGLLTNIRTAIRRMSCGNQHQQNNCFRDLAIQHDFTVG